MSCAKQHEKLAGLVDELPRSWAIDYMRDWRESDSFSEVELKSGYDLEKASRNIDHEDEAIKLFMGATRDDWDAHLDEDASEFRSERDLYLTHSFENAAGYSRVATERKYGEADIEKAVILEVEVPVDNIHEVDDEPHLTNENKGEDIEYGHFEYGVRGVEGVVGSAYSFDWVSYAYRPNDFWDAEIENSQKIEI